MDAQNRTSGSLAVVNVTAGQSYRFRIINTGCLPAFNFSIDGHKLTIIEADGIITHPVTVDSFEIFPGEPTFPFFWVAQFLI